MQAVILAGGRGTRLRSVTGDLPKPLMDMDGRPLLAHHLDMLKRAGTEDVLLLTGYRSDLIRQAVGDGAAFGVRIRYAEEDAENPLGTAGALLRAFGELEERIVVLYGDCMLEVDLPRMVAWHLEHGSDASLLVHPNSHPYDSDLMECDGDARVTAFHPYPHPDGAILPNLVNAAVYVIETGALAPYRDTWLADQLSVRKPDIAKHLFPAMLADGRKLFAYRSPEYVKDAGTPDRYDAVLRDLKSGKIARASLAHRQKAIFLDRDGTLNVEVNRVSHPDALEIIEGVPAAVRRINESEYRAVVVTNQAVVARGDADEAMLARIHAKLDTVLGREKAYLDALYYCPHHPDRGFAGEVAALKIDCNCRKPKPGLLLAAQVDLNIDFARSWMIGDTSSDMETARRLGVRPVLVRTGKAGQDGLFDAAPDAAFDTLGEAVDFILAQPALD